MLDQFSQTSLGLTHSIFHNPMNPMDPMNPMMIARIIHASAAQKLALLPPSSTAGEVLSSKALDSVTVEEMTCMSVRPRLLPSWITIPKTIHASLGPERECSTDNEQANIEDDVHAE